MTDADRSTGNAFGFARGPAALGQEPPLAMLEGPGKVDPPDNPAAGILPISKENKPAPSGASPDFKLRRRPPGMGEVGLEMASTSQDPDVTAQARNGEPKVWLAVSLAGLTYLVGIAGFMSTILNFYLAQ